MIDRTDRRTVGERRYNALFNPNDTGSRGLTRYELERVVSYLNSNTPADEQVTTLHSLFTRLLTGAERHHGTHTNDENSEYVCCS